MWIPWLIAAQLLSVTNVREVGKVAVTEVRRSEQVFLGVVSRVRLGKNCTIEVLPTEALKGALPKSPVTLASCNRLLGRQPGVVADELYAEGEYDVFFVRDGSAGAFVALYSTRASWIVGATRIKQVREMVRFVLEDQTRPQRTKTIAAWLRSNDSVLVDAALGLAAAPPDDQWVNQEVVIEALLELAGTLQQAQQRRAFKALSRLVKQMRALAATDDAGPRRVEVLARRVEAFVAKLQAGAAAQP